MSENKKHLILVVEDDHGTQKLHKTALEKAGYLIETAINYQEALDKIHNGNIDLAVIDIELDKNDPENADGLRVVAQINKLENKPQVILATGLIQRVTPAWRESVFEVWEKSEPRDSLLKKIEMALETKKELTPAKIKNSLNTIIGKMARERLNLEQVLDLILNEMVALIKAESANLSIVDNNKIKVKATTLRNKNAKKEFDVENSVSGLAIRRQKTVHFPDIENNEVARTLFQPSLGEDKRKGSEFAVPIMVDLEPIAVINFESPHKSAFKENDIRLIEELAGQVAIAINSARLQDQTNIVKGLSEISSELNTSIDRGENVIAEITVDKMLEFMKCDKAAIFNYDIDHSKIDFIAHKGLSKEYILSNFSIDSPRSLVARTKQPVIISDIENDELHASIRDLAVNEGYRAILELPLQVRGKMVGSISAYYSDIHYFESEELALARLFADHVAVAFNNAQQYQILHELKEREKKEVEERLAAEIVHRLNNPLGAVRAWVKSIEDDPIINANPETKEALIFIKENAERAMALVKQLRNKHQELEAKIVELPEQIKNAILVLNIDNTKYTVDFQESSNTAHVLADDQLSRVFENLLQNSLDAMLDGGKIVIKMNTSNEFAYTVISDTGHGFRPEAREELFKQWFTNKDGIGHGYGLWWVKKYVNAYGGTIDATSEGINKGATFTLGLPLEKTRQVATIMDSIIKRE